MNTAEKISDLIFLKEKVNQLQTSGQKVVFTNGCFDILHFGHVSYLEKARSLGDCLIIAINSDKSVQSIKGSTRPIIPESGRARLLAALKCVDYVVMFDEDTPLNVISEIKPNVLVKGADWKGKGIVGADVVELNGGIVEYIDFVEGFSTTNVIETILKKCQ